MSRLPSAFCIVTALLVAAIGPGRGGAEPPSAFPGDAVKSAIILATTTSTQDSGLLDVLVPRFEADSGIEVR